MLHNRQLFSIVAFLIVSEALLAVVLAFGVQEIVFPSGANTAASAWEALACGLVVAFANNRFCAYLNLYSARRPSRFLHSAARIVAANLLSFGLLGLLSIFFSIFYCVEKANLLTWFCLQSVSMITLRFLVDKLCVMRSELYHTGRRMLVVGCDAKADYVCKALDVQRSWGHVLLGFLAIDETKEPVVYGYKCLGYLKDLEMVLLAHAVDEVIFALPAARNVALQPQLRICEMIGVDVRIVPAIYNPADDYPMHMEQVQGIPMLSRTMTPLNPSGYLYKRIFDYAVGIVGSVLCLCLYPVVGLLIRIDSPGPVIYKQTRIGLHGRPFFIYKFRTMYDNAEERKKELRGANSMQGCMFKIDDDPRVTRVGRFLRRTSLDEFPQFFNVLRGEMSVVGTRPPTEDEVSKYSLWHRRRLSMRPGITGLWQVSGRSKIRNFDKIVEMDLKYIDGWRFMRDVWIVLRTILVVFTGRGAV